MVDTRSPILATCPRRSTAHPASYLMKFLVHADNVEFYAHNGVPFVVGTTGGDREKLLADAQSAGCYAVIAPQMGKQVCTYPYVQRCTLYEFSLF